MPKKQPITVDDLSILQAAALNLADRAFNALLTIRDEDEREFLVHLFLSALGTVTGDTGHAQRVLAEAALLIATKAAAGLDFDEQRSALYTGWAVKHTDVIERLRRERTKARVG